MSYRRTKIPLGRPDGRTREARYLRDVEAAMVEHIGEPSFTQRVLITRAARAMLRLAQFDDQMATGKELSDHSGRVYGALNNTLRLALRELGLKGGSAKPKAPTISELVAKYAVLEGRTP